MSELPSKLSQESSDPLKSIYESASSVRHALAELTNENVHAGRASSPAGLNFAATQAVLARRAEEDSALAAVATHAVAISTAVAVMVETEQVEEVAEGRAVERHVRIMVINDRVREIIPAARRQWFQEPIPLDELQDRDVVGVGVADVASPSEGRHCVGSPHSVKLPSKKRSTV
jgi:hypothetical protein